MSEENQEPEEEDNNQKITDFSDNGYTMNMNNFSSNIRWLREEMTPIP